MLKKLLEAKRRVNEAMSRINDNELEGIREEIRVYQRPAITAGNVKGPCEEMERWETGITKRIDCWIERKRRDLGDPDGYLASSVGHDVLNKMHKDSVRYLKAVLKK